MTGHCPPPCSEEGKQSLNRSCQTGLKGAKCGWQALTGPKLVQRNAHSSSPCLGRLLASVPIEEANVYGGTLVEVAREDLKGGTAARSAVGVASHTPDLSAGNANRNLFNWRYRGRLIILR